jgi:hypothetical protein
MIGLSPRRIQQKLAIFPPSMRSEDSVPFSAFSKISRVFHGPLWSRNSRAIWGSLCAGAVAAICRPARLHAAQGWFAH